MFQLVCFNLRVSVSSPHMMSPETLKGLLIKAVQILYFTSHLPTPFNGSVDENRKLLWNWPACRGVKASHSPNVQIFHREDKSHEKTTSIVIRKRKKFNYTHRHKAVKRTSSSFHVSTVSRVREESFGRGGSSTRMGLLPFRTRVKEWREQNDFMYSADDADFSG